MATIFSESAVLRHLVGKTMSLPYPGTFHGFNGHTNGEHIDWILYRGHIAPVDYTMVVSTFEGIYPSDHFPVYARSKWIDKS